MILSSRNTLQDNVVTNSGRRISYCENTVGHGQCSTPSYSESYPLTVTLCFSCAAATLVRSSVRIILKPLYRANKNKNPNYLYFLIVRQESLKQQYSVFIVRVTIVFKDFRCNSGALISIWKVQLAPLKLDHSLLHFICFFFLHFIFLTL